MPCAQTIGLPSESVKNTRDGEWNRALQQIVVKAQIDLLIVVVESLLTLLHVYVGTKLFLRSEAMDGG